MNNHEIDYKLYGDDMQFVEVELDPSETVIAEAGSLMMMDDQIRMETIFGDGSTKQTGGIMGKLIGAGKRLVTGESLFMTTFTNEGTGKKHVSFASPYPGKIIPMDLSELNGELICQKDAFLAAAKGVSVGIALQRRIGTGFFGGEGFIMQKLEGDGLAFVHAGGTIHRRDLKSGEILRVDTGCLVAMTGNIDYDIEYVGGIKTALFGGEGLFFATLRGPGTVWIQSLPFSRLASRVFAAAPQRAGSDSKGEGSIAGGLFDLLGGDRK
ncbi:TIGR00266 family protein [Oceanobacillus profundus]|uniref:TIGR00266 family protein n=1 Tax=Oceanobacillus TaxID=182709 RepID=UPI0026E3FFC2|nr:TIGR00266 family protein [Oceanobacillus profundus]MDO6450280.1 TIGR00266 family protein [Oceanobacillus profundus]